MEDRDPSFAALEKAFARYEQAQSGRDREEQLRTRLALCVVLLDSGWEAPPAVREQMDRDERALRRLRHSDVVDLRDASDRTGWRWLQQGRR